MVFFGKLWKKNNSTWVNPSWIRKSHHFGQEPHIPRGHSWWTLQNFFQHSVCKKKDRRSPVAIYIVSPTHIFAVVNLFRYSRRHILSSWSIYCRWDEIFTLQTYCRRRQYVLKCAAYIVAPHGKTFQEDNWVNYI